MGGQSSPRGSSPPAPGRANHVPGAPRPTGALSWLGTARRTTSPHPEQEPLRPGLASHSSHFPSSGHTGLNLDSSVAEWSWEAEELEGTAVPEVYVVFCESRSTTFRLLSLAPWRMPGATDGKTATLGQRGPSLSCTSMVLTALMTSGGKQERLRMLRQVWNIPW